MIPVATESFVLKSALAAIFFSPFSLVVTCFRTDASPSLSISLHPQFDQ